MSEEQSARVCAEDELKIGDVEVVSLGRDKVGLPFQIVVLRDSNGEIRAYRNQCKHLPIPLDSGTRDFKTDDQRHLICRTHGALYRITDGYCTRGPCAGTTLQSVKVENRDGELWVTRS